MSDSPVEMPNEDPQEAALRERLVAYLDRELPHDESERVEQKIADDESARSTLEEFDRVWRALDALPVEKTEANFTRTTLALATQASLAGGPTGKGQLQLPNQPLWKRLRWLAPAACALAAFVVAWFAMWLPQRRTLDTLPVALASDALKQIEDLEFLRQLAERSPELQLAAAAPAFVSEAEEWRAVDRMTLGERREWVHGLDDQRRDAVARQAVSLRAAGVAAQPIVDRHEALMAAEDASALAGYAATYGAYVASLSTGDQAELRTSDPDRRLRRVSKDLRRWRIQRALEITAAERSVIADHLDQVASSELIERVAEQIESARGRRAGSGRYAQMIKSRVRATPAAVFARMGTAHRRANDGRPPRNPRDALSRFFGRELSRSWPEIEQAIVAGLPERVARVFLEEELTDDNRTEAVVRVLSQVVGGDTPGDLGEVFESLNSDQQIRYLGMPVDEMLERLDNDWATNAGFAEPGTSDREPPFPPRFGPPGVRPPDGLPRGRDDPRRSRRPPPPDREGRPPRPR